jgi:hypothetical protein
VLLVHGSAPNGQREQAQKGKCGADRFGESHGVFVLRHGFSSVFVALVVFGVFLFLGLLLAAAQAAHRIQRIGPPVLDEASVSALLALVVA